ncbi:MAG: translational activator for mitochondrial COX1 [Watsoniomyces obsoletus]|nr:MAG: translational activator for mitochondrial COX1 [Watsoniomyces obsoletus]
MAQQWIAAKKEATKNTMKRVSSRFSLGSLELALDGGRSSRDQSPRGLEPAAVSTPGSAQLQPPSPWGEVASQTSSRTSSPRDAERHRTSWRSQPRGSSAEGPAAAAAAPRGPPYWAYTVAGKTEDYDVSALTNGQKVPDMWDDTGDTLVYVLPRGEGAATPSFRIHSALLTSSSYLFSLAQGGRRASRDALDADVTPAPDYHLRYPLTFRGGPRTTTTPTPTPTPTTRPTPVAPTVESSTDLVEELVAVRNLFAFLAGRSLVASRKHPTVFGILLRVADKLGECKFSNLDGSTFGEVPQARFAALVDRWDLADVRSSRQKTMEAIVLAERMRSSELYREAFVHGVGKYEAMTGQGGPIIALICPITRSRMERASMGLSTRINSVRSRLTDFEFPSIFAGIANSTTSEESKTVHFKAWKSAFGGMRRYVLGYCKHRFGAWPPKPSSKRTTSGWDTGALNRLVLKALYQDFSDLYDLLVDRAKLTTRGSGGGSGSGPGRRRGGSRGGDGDDGDDEEEGKRRNDGADEEEVMGRALRRVLSEFDRSSPPVQPPIPFDTPLLPGVSSWSTQLRPDRTRKLKEHEVGSLLGASHNLDAMKRSEFLTHYLTFERKAAVGKSVEELCDQRNGYWIFVYAVLQSLPLVVVDALGLRYTDQVEYFLCEAPKGPLPWLRAESSRHQKWSETPRGAAAIVNPPADAVKHGVEGIYHRSHCWEVAERWVGNRSRASSKSSMAPSYHPSSYQPPSYQQQQAPYPPTTLPYSRGSDGSGIVPSVPSSSSASAYPPTRSSEYFRGSDHSGVIHSSSSSAYPPASRSGSYGGGHSSPSPSSTYPPASRSGSYGGGGYSSGGGGGGPSSPLFLPHHYYTTGTGYSEGSRSPAGYSSSGLNSPIPNSPALSATSRQPQQQHQQQQPPSLSIPHPSSFSSARPSPSPTSPIPAPDLGVFERLPSPAVAATAQQHQMQSARPRHEHNPNKNFSDFIPDDPPSSEKGKGKGKGKEKEKEKKKWSLT